MTRSVLPQRTQDDESSSSDRTSSSEVRVPKKRVRRRQRFDPLVRAALLARYERAENSGQSVIMTRAMKKLRDQKEREQNKRRRAALDYPDDDSASTSADPESCNTSVEVVGKRGDKRKVAAADGGRNSKRRRTDTEDREHQERNRHDDNTSSSSEEIQSLVDNDSASNPAEPESCNTSVEVVGKRGDKRKVAAAEEGRNSKRRRTDAEDREHQERNGQDDNTSSSSEEIQSLVDSDSASNPAEPESCNTSVEVVGKRGDKRKVAAAEEGRIRRKEQTRKNQQKKNKEAFETKYEELDFISGGGCGSVYAGFRRADDLPVAIKHILNEMILITHDDEEGNVISIEVAIMQKLAESEGPSAHVTLLDWYQLEKELVLVMERPMPAEDFHDYLRELGGCIKEDEAKIILRQLVDAALDLESKNIFHRDIKLENILIETSSDVPRVRIIDFGLSCFDERKETYPDFCGTLLTPEFYCETGFKAGPTTVYQIGAVLYNALHKKEFFDTIKFASRAQFLPRRISKKCRNFLQMCLRVDPAHRPTLEQLRNHQWLE
uniref:aurora kinase-like isoform X1 n=1 Tax=Gasterosteus aculeatus aculeatus TaxID=481459 RepID=UPI001A9A10AC|nr:aurora kinase-like isoform X1 [Gasterosteus aculeatus aculeatus]